MWQLVTITVVGDAGFFGPDSVAWKVHADSSGLVGGIRSLMVQALEPRAMAGVAQHSEFRDDFWGRLRRTSDYLLTVIYGTKAEAEQASAIVRAVHGRISGHDHFSHADYRADDPELLQWVHNATVDSYLHAFRSFGNQLDGAETDQYIDEMRTLGRLMGLDEERLVNDEQGLIGYFTVKNADLGASPEAKQATRILLNPEMPVLFRALWTTAATDAYASMPKHYRDLYGFAWAPPVGFGAHIGATFMLRALQLLLPPPPIIESAYDRTSRVG